MTKQITRVILRLVSLFMGAAFIYVGASYLMKANNWLAKHSRTIDEWAETCQSLSAENHTVSLIYLDRNGFYQTITYVNGTLANKAIKTNTDQIFHNTKKEAESTIKEKFPSSKIVITPDIVGTGSVEAWVSLPIGSMFIIMGVSTIIGGFSNSRRKVERQASGLPSMHNTNT